MNKPRIFIGSSTEGLEVAKAIHQNLDHFAEVTIWTQGVFKLSVSTITTLMNSLTLFDFAIFVFSPDDITNLRGTNFSTVRDNVIFETGLFAGRLGISKVFFLKPRDQPDFHLPTDLLGVTTGDYNSNRRDKNIIAATDPFCSQVQQQIIKINANVLTSKVEHKKYGNPEIDSDPDLQILFAYISSRKLTAISFEKLKENVHPKFTEDYVMKIIERHPLLIRRSKLKNSKPGIKILLTSE
ncbi:MAG TPA: nucleotide-binding protein [Chitinophagaceae bacterium]|nr:nucleotide-binding protein [Chitinophagaceae bacterium]